MLRSVILGQALQALAVMQVLPQSQLQEVFMQATTKLLFKTSMDVQIPAVLLLAYLIIQPLHLLQAIA